MKKRIKKILLLVTIGVIAFCFIYVNDYYRALEEIKGYQVEDNINIEVLEDGTIVCEPKEAHAGIIFYPGGKVEYTAYLPLMKTCASKGVFCILVEMPFNLAVLEIDAADGLQEKYPEIKSWYMAGHSLGGSMAAAYIESATDKYEGLILLGAYGTKDLSDTDLKVLSIYGSEDRIMKMNKYNENKKNMPLDFEEQIIQGGNHAGFGMYGVQDGDGVAEITNAEQIQKTADIIWEFIVE